MSAVFAVEYRDRVDDVVGKTWPGRTFRCTGREKLTRRHQEKLSVKTMLTVWLGATVSGSLSPFWVIVVYVNAAGRKILPPFKAEEVVVQLFGATFAFENKAPFDKRFELK